MKIAVCGKGGSGKSTISALLAKELARRGQSVLVIDSDESNYGLHRQLGMEPPKDFTAYFGGKEKVLEDMMLSNFTHKFFEGEWTLLDIPHDYCREKEGVLLMAGGKIHRANEGCACAMGSVIAQLIANLRLKFNETAIIDMEAGIEHFGRGVDNGVDLVLMVVDPSYESLRLSKKIAELSGEIGKPIYFVLNKVDEENEADMRRAVADESRIAAAFPTLYHISAAGLFGSELSSGYPEIQRLADVLLSV